LSSQGWEYYSYVGILDNLLASRGLRWWDDTNQQFNFDSEEGVQAMKLLVETPVQMGIETQLDKQGIDTALAGGVAIVRGNGTPATDEGWKLGYHYEIIAAPPAIEGQPPVYADEASWGFAATADAPNQQIAIEFLKMMATIEGQREYAKIYGGMLQVACVPLIEAADHFAEGVTQEPLTRAFQTVVGEILVPNTLGIPYVYNGSELQSKIQPAFADVRTGKITSEEAVKMMQVNAEAVWKTYQDQVKKAG